MRRRGMGAPVASSPANAAQRTPRRVDGAFVRARRSRRRCADGRRAGRRWPGQGRPPAGASRRTRPRHGQPAAFRAHWVHGRRARTMAKRRRGADDSRPLRAARVARALLAHYRARMVAFPSAGPETFSFTLSEAWAAGLPVVVPPFGALGERVADAGAGWLWTDAEWRDESKMLARIAELVAPANAASAGRMSDARVAQFRHPTPEAMAERTLEIYDAAIDASRGHAGPDRRKGGRFSVCGAPPPRTRTSCASCARSTCTSAPAQHD